MKTLKESLKKLNPEQIAFICKECSVAEEELNEMEEEQLYDNVFEVMCNIEIEEVCSRSEAEEDSERCEMASDIVTIFGKALEEADCLSLDEKD